MNRFFFHIFFYLLIYCLHSSSCFALCESYIKNEENIHKIPRYLLKSIAMIESGRLVKGQKIAWPWTINVDGRGYTFNTKEEAIAAVKLHRQNGATSIDVGCMQVNLKHHPHAFSSLSQAFDPSSNVAYAASFLKNLKNQFGNWKTAVAHYHSATPLFHKPYREKVHNVWQQFRQNDGNQTPILQDAAYTVLENLDSYQKMPSPQKSYKKQTPFQKTIYPTLPETKKQKINNNTQSNHLLKKPLAPRGKFFPIPTGRYMNTPQPTPFLRVKKTFYKVPLTAGQHFIPVKG